MENNNNKKVIYDKYVKMLIRAKSKLDIPLNPQSTLSDWNNPIKNKKNYKVFKRNLIKF